MDSLKQVFSAMQSRDHEKVAAARAAQGHAPERDFSQIDPGLLKQAQGYEMVGRTLAHHVFADMVKTAVEEAMPGASEEDKKESFEDAMAAAMGEKKKETKKEGEGEDEPKEEAKDGEEKTSAAKLRAKKKKILAKMAADPQYTSQLIAKFMGR